MTQLSFSLLEFWRRKKQTKRDLFLAEVLSAVPWKLLTAQIEPCYPKTGPQGGRRPFPLSAMLRTYCPQQ